MNLRKSELSDLPLDQTTTDKLPPVVTDVIDPNDVEATGDSGSSDAVTPNDDNEGYAHPPGILAGVGKMILETGPVSLPLKGLGRAFKAFEHLDYRYIWFGALLSNMGMWIQAVAMQWNIKLLAAESSALWLGRSAFFQQMSMVVLLPLGGMLADRIDRRWILLASNIFLAILALVLAVTTAQGQLRMWHLMGLVTLMGISSAMTIPANQSLLPSLVSKTNLPNAVALNAMQFNLSRAVGPAIGGAALVSLGAAWSFGINSFSYIFIIAAVLMIRKPKTIPRRHESFLASLTGGASYVRTRKDLQLMLSMVFISGVAAAPLLFMLPAVVEQLFDNSENQFSLLLSCFGIGAVFGAAMLAMRSHKFASPWRGFFTMGIFGLLQCLISFQSSFHVTMVLVFFCGMTFIASLNRFFAATISSIPNHLRGRVSSIHVLCLTLGTPLGSMLAGTIAESYGMIPVLRYFGLSLTVALCFAGLIIWKCKLAFIEHDDSDYAHFGDQPDAIKPADRK